MLHDPYKFSPVRELNALWNLVTMKKPASLVGSLIDSHPENIFFFPFASLFYHNVHRVQMWRNWEGLKQKCDDD